MQANDFGFCSKENKSFNIYIFLIFNHQFEDIFKY